MPRPRTYEISDPDSIEGRFAARLDLLIKTICDVPTLAKRTGLSDRVIYRRLYGERLGYVDRLVRLAAHYGTTAEKLCRGVKQPEQLGTRLAAARAKRDESMRDVGKALGITFARIRELEKATNPKHLEILITIAKGLRVDLGKLFEGIEANPD